MINFGSFVSTLPPNDGELATAHQQEIDQLSEHINYGFVFDDDRWKELAYDFYTAKRIAELIDRLFSSHQGALSILEVGAGSNENILRAVLFGLKSRSFNYVSYNENPFLSQEFKERAKYLNASFEIRDADFLRDGAENEKFDLVILQHSVNDIVENSVAKLIGVDTVNRSWWSSRSERFRMMNELMQDDNGLLKVQSVLESFVEKLTVRIKVRGMLLANHCCFQNEVRDGYCPYLNNQYIALFRSIAAKANVLVEIESGLDPRWWYLSRRS